jgi:hypothetical protein
MFPQDLLHSPNPIIQNKIYGIMKTGVSMFLEPVRLLGSWVLLSPFDTEFQFTEPLLTKRKD